MTTKNWRQRNRPALRTERCRNPSNKLINAATGLALLISTLSATGQTDRLRLELVGQCTIIQSVGGGEGIPIAIESRFLALGQGRTVLAASGGLGMATVDILDVSDPTRPRLLGTYVDTRGGRGKGLTAVGGRAYLLSGWSVSIIDTTDPANPVLLGMWTSYQPVEDIQVVGEYAYVTGRDPHRATGVVHVLDVGNASSPSEAAPQTMAVQLDSDI